MLVATAAVLTDVVFGVQMGVHLDWHLERYWYQEPGVAVWNLRVSLRKKLQIGCSGMIRRYEYICT